MGRKDGIVFGTAAGIYGLRRLDAAGSSTPKGLSSRPAKGPMGSPDEPGMTEGYYPAASGSFSHFEAGTESVDYQEYK